VQETGLLTLGAQVNEHMANPGENRIKRQKSFSLEAIHESCQEPDSTPVRARFVDTWFIRQKSYSFWRIEKANEPVFTPTLIICFWTDGVQLPPTCCQRDLILGNSLADQSCSDPLCAAL
jgi:hypothetical protein